jgi:hypothetical protein
VAGEDAPSNTGDASNGPEKSQAVSSRRRSVNFSAVIALISALAATGSAVYTYSQVQVSRQQNIVAEQQQLLSLVVAIEQEPALLAQATATLTGSTLINTDIAYQNEIVADGETAVLLIEALRGQGVTGIEYYQVGLALESGGNNGLAITYFGKAAGIAEDPDTLASALRDEALLRYRLGNAANDSTAHQEMMSAVNAYRGQYVTSTEFEQNAALSYLEDAEYQIVINGCRAAQADLNRATQAIVSLGSSASIAAADRNKLLMAQDQASLKLHCR